MKIVNNSKVTPRKMVTAIQVSFMKWTFGAQGKEAKLDRGMQLGRIWGGKPGPEDIRNAMMVGW